MQWLTADIVFDGYDFYTDFYIEVDSKGAISQTAREKPLNPVRVFNGLLMPGMVNAHCHLELSHTKGLIDEKIGLSNFLQKVSEVIPDKVPDQTIREAMRKADQEMYANGIVAVGDICNTRQSIAVKQESHIRYHNFIECIAIREQDTERRFKEYYKIYEEFRSAGLSSSLALHTPYTCNEGMYKMVDQHSDFISIHNQESQAENLLFERRPSSFDAFYEHFGLDKGEIIKQDTLYSSFKNSLRLLSEEKKVLFVHNTYTGLDNASADKNHFWCFCPKANLYIENDLPKLLMFPFYRTRQFVLGTDSLASNDRLSILSEAKVLQDNFPEFRLQQILQWATSNGAKIFGLENEIGSFERGKTPGFVHVESFDIRENKLLTDTCVRVEGF